MRRKLAVLLATAALTVPFGAAAYAGASDTGSDRARQSSGPCEESEPDCENKGGKGGKGGGGEEGEESNACPEKSKNPNGTPPSCGKQDRDGDGVPDETDNCPDIANPGQEDSDNDGTGDACEQAPPPDRDNDGVPDADDNCPDAPNPNQEDADNNGVGDACEQAPPPDRDNDGVPDADDNCPDAPNPNQEDADNDGVGDACDTVEPADACSADAGDEGLSGDGTIGQQLADNGLIVSPVTEDPDGNGAISGEIKSGGEGTEAEILTDEIGCLVDFLVDEEVAPLDP